MAPAQPALLRQDIPSVVDEIPAIVAGLRATFDSGRTRPLSWRKAQLKALARLLRERESELLEALRADLGKSDIEGWITEVNFALSEVKHAISGLSSWVKPERVSIPIVAQPGRAAVQREPLGVVLIISPWNYPLQLILGPLLGALAAGNCALLKPSEVAPATSAAVAKLVPEYLDPACVRVVEGGVRETTALLAERFDHVFYTGNGHVGRIVMEAAAKHLTPVTLELGGKSPVIIDRDVDLDVAARRLVWGKWTNAGQTCVAPDYLLIHESIKPALVEKLKATVAEFFGSDPSKSPDYGRIINARHHRRLVGLLPGSGRVVLGGQHDEADRYIAPTILDDVPLDSPIMADEIFGPILPIFGVKSIDEAIAFVNARPKPLALYVFTSTTATADHVLDRTSSGGAVVNHLLIHLGVPNLPFGGVGASGIGAYHGKASFDLFSHKKAVLRKPFALDPPFMYPPYDDSKKKWLKRLL